MYRAFVEVLERDFARHHAAGYYADALRVPQAALSRALAHVTGRTTKELVTDRRMLEAARLLRFTNMTVGEVGYRAGFEDQLYFSRAFKRATGEAPRPTGNESAAALQTPDLAEIRGRRSIPDNEWERRPAPEQAGRRLTSR